MEKREKLKRVLVVLVAIVGYLFLRVYSSDRFSTSILFEMLFCISFGFWGITTQRRITDKRCRKLFGLLALSIVFWFYLKLIKYLYLYNETLIRFVWYLYYVLLMLIILLSFFIAICMMQDQSEKPLKKWIWLEILGGVFDCFVLTNDFHQMIFRFPEGIRKGNEIYEYGFGFWVLQACMFGLGIVTLAIILKKCSLPQCRKKIYIPIVIVMTILLYTILFVIGIKLKWKDIELVRVPDFLCFSIVLTWESLIQIGLFPSNSGYSRFFMASNIQAQILDEENHIIYSSAKMENITLPEVLPVANSSVMIDENHRLNASKIHGGTLLFIEDFTYINDLKRQMSEAKEVIAGENTLIQEENKLKEENIRYQILNKVYDEIALHIHPQVLAIEKLLDQELEEENFKQNLAKASFLNAYIKRRSNLILQGKQTRNMDVMELYLALQESIRWLEICGKYVFVKPYNEEKNLPAARICSAYDFFEYFLEQNFDFVLDLMIDLTVAEEVLTLRLIMDMEGDVLKLPKTSATTEIIKDEDGTIVVARFEEGGESV